MEKTPEELQQEGNRTLKVISAQIMLLCGIGGAIVGAILGK